MPKPTVPAADGAMPAESHKTRRSALALFVAAPTLAILPAAAVASPTSTARLADLIAVHRAAVDAAVDADEARYEVTEPDVSGVSFLGRYSGPIGLGTPRERLTRGVELGFEMIKHTMSGWLSPELGEAALRDLEKGKADSLAQIEEAYADYDAAKSAADEAEKVCIKALEAVCAHRCASVEELATKVRYLATWGMELQPNQSEALYKSFLPEGEEIAAI